MKSRWIILTLLLLPIFESLAESSTLENISTRGLVGTGDEVIIGGFIIGGNQDKTVTIRARGESLQDADPNLQGLLADPELQIFDSSGALIDSNDNWADHTSSTLLRTDLRPTRAQESAITTTLSPGAYTAIVRGSNNSAGMGIVEVFDIDTSSTSFNTSGIWFGSSTSNQGLTTRLIMITTSDGRLAALGADTGAQFVGNFDSSGLNIDGNGVGVTPPGFVWLDGSTRLALSYAGQFQERSSITATWESPATGENGTLQFEFDAALHDRPSSAANFQGPWATVQQVSIDENDQIIFAGAIETEFQLNNGSLIGTDSVGCEYTGTITPINSNVNVYDAVVTVSNCSDGGKYRGIGTLIDSVFSDGTLNPNSAFVFSGTNGVNYRTDVLFRLE